MRTLNFWLLSLLFLFANEAAATSTIYINYETSCFDKYEYMLNDGADQKKYYTYHLKKGKNERVILDVGTGASERFSSRPQNVKHCYDLQFNEAFAKKVNSGELVVYVLMQDSYGYAAIPVANAAYFFNNYDGLAFATKEYAFNYNYFQDGAGTDLALANSGSIVRYAGLVSNVCPKKFIFTKKDKLNDFTTQITMVPNVGIIELKSEIKPPFIANNKLNLVRINNLTLTDFMTRQCNGQSTTVTSTTSQPTRTYQPPITTGVVTTPSKPTTSTSGHDWRSQTTVPPVHVGTIDHNNKPTTTTGTTTTTTTIPTTQPTYTQPTYTSNNPTTTSYPSTSTKPDGTVYKDLDRGLYIDRSTGLPADGMYGGVMYVRGYMQGEGATASTPTTTPAPVKNVQPYTPPSRTYYPSTSTTYPSTSTAPAPVSQPVVTSSNNCNKPSRYGYHVVNPKETLYRISKIYNVSVADIKRWNKLRNNKIGICSELRVKPPAPATTSTYTPASSFASKGQPTNLNWKKPTNHIHLVQHGETLYSIGKIYGYTPERMIAMNNLSSATISPGQQLYTNDCNCPSPENPYGEVTSSTSSVPAPYANTGTVRLVEKGQSIQPTGSTKRRVHIVKKKETLYSISKKYNLPIRLIREFNNLSRNEVILPFQKIYLER